MDRTPEEYRFDYKRQQITRSALLFLSRRESISGERPTSFQKKIQPSLTRDLNPLGYKPRVIATILAGTEPILPSLNATQKQTN
ncbi:hypothetical protein TNCV_3696731 [Trichonephila clavipes]|uniref:Uncharacterized protein n=1 Tax=Trichonephila clavipes TaxID=2585209 RepID=A0A8X6SJS2_TRICX|nr:hypothetical protein TNCV_3696731 [Trichonephila clavipes]